MTWYDVAAFAAAFGCGSVVVSVSMCLRARRINRRFPDLHHRWKALPRRTRRRIRKAIFAGRSIPAQHAQIALESIAAGEELDRERGPRRRNIAAASAVYAGGLAVGSVLIVEGSVWEGLALIGYMTSHLLAIANALRLLRRFPERRAAARAEAERLLRES
jgi:hypothetical protein